MQFTSKEIEAFSLGRVVHEMGDGGLKFDNLEGDRHIARMGGRA